MKLLKGYPIDYAGDGVYVVTSTHGVWLHANDHANPTDKVYIEDTVMDTILRIRKQGRRYIEGLKVT